MPEPKRPLKVFLCHASLDKPKVRELYRYLRRRGIKPWFDEIDLIGGQDWQVEIPKALLTSDAIIICLTKNSVDKEGYIQKEIKFALDKALEMPEGKIFLIPVRFEECEVPYSLGRYQWVDLFDEVGYARMMRSLKFRASQLNRDTVQVSLSDIKEEKLALEKAVREKEEHEAAERTAQEKAEREKAEKAAQEKLEREAAEKARREETERKGAEKAARDKAKREAMERDKRERAERRATQIGVLKQTFSKFSNRLRLALPKTTPFLRVGGMIGIILVLFWIVSWVTPQIPSLVPTEKVSATLRPSATLTLTPTPVTPSQTIEPSPTLTQTITPTATLLPLEITDAKGISMHLVSAGEFTMGFSADDANSFCQTLQSKIPYYGFCRRENYLNEEPLHEVYLNNFFMDVYEVSNGDYEKCVAERVCTQPSKTSANRYSSYYNNENFRKYPVIYLTWDMAKTYCEWRGARLPTESEWEKAARGIYGRIYPWGDYNSAYKLYDRDFYTNKANPKLDAFSQATVSVDSNSEGLSPYGLYNMAGNVAEWVADWYSETYYRESPSENPLGPLSGEYKVIRGGSVETSEIWTSVRDFLKPSEGTNYVGFRCAKDATP